MRRSHLLLRGRRGALYQNKLKPAILFQSVQRSFEGRHAGRLYGAIVRRSHLLLRGRRGALYQNKLKPAILLQSVQKSFEGRHAGQDVRRARHSGRLRKNYDLGRTVAAYIVLRTI